MNRRQWLQRFALWTMAGSAFAILGGILLDVWRAAGLFSTSHWREVGRLADFPRDGTYPLPETPAAIEQVAQGHARGTVVIAMAQPAGSTA